MALIIRYHFRNSDGLSLNFAEMACYENTLPSMITRLLTKLIPLHINCSSKIGEFDSEY